MTAFVVALGGNPNAGKTTLFNSFTGARQHVGNYPGVTVEKREGLVSFEGRDIHIVDLPGTYSLTSWSEEERVARNVLVYERPSAVIDVVDATSLDRNLYLTVQLLELGVPTVLALNMMDEIRKSGRRIHTEKLASLLDIPVVETVARKGEGKRELLQAAIGLAEGRAKNWKPLRISYGSDIDPVLDAICELLSEEKSEVLRPYPPRWLAVKYLEGDPEVRRLCHEEEKLGTKIKALSDRLHAHCRNVLGTPPESLMADHRYGFINTVTRQVVERGQDTLDERIRISDAMDKVLTQRVIGPLVMLAVFYFMFVATFALGEYPAGWLENFFGWLSGTMTGLLPKGLLQSLVVSGIIDGVGGVLGFVPLILIMFLMVTFLEDAGYMARMAYMLDRVFRAFGLHGASVMPFVISGGIPGGCAVPGVMAARTLKSPKERLATLLTVPFMNCGAKVPVFLLLCGTFFAEHAAGAMFVITLASWAMALLVARVLRSTVIRGEAAPFVMELPPYRMPTLQGVLLHTWERAWQYIKKAGTIILAISILIWGLMTFPGLPEDVAQDFETRRSLAATLSDGEKQVLAVEAAEAEAALRNSAAGRLGSLFEPVSSLAGFDWRTNIALIGGFAAKEVIVSTLGTAYSMGEVEPEEAEKLGERLARDPGWSLATAIALIAFVMLYSPCFVTVIAIVRESNWKWGLFSMGFNTVFAFVVSVILYQLVLLMI